MTLKHRIAVGAVAVTAGAFMAVGLQAADKRVATAAAAPNLAYVDGVVARYTAIPKFTLKAPAFNAKKLSGKSILNILVSNSIPYDAAMGNAQASVAKRFGIKYTDYPNQGQVSQWVQGFNQAIARKPDLILLLGTPPYALTTQLRSAKSAGVPVLSTHAVDPTMPKPASAPPIVYQLFTKAAKLDADYVISDTRGKANVIIVTSNDFQPSRYMVKAIQRIREVLWLRLQEHRRRCSGRGMGDEDSGRDAVSARG